MTGSAEPVTSACGGCLHQRRVGPQCVSNAHLRQRCKQMDCVQGIPCSPGSAAQAGKSWKKSVSCVRHPNAPPFIPARRDESHAGAMATHGRSRTRGRPHRHRRKTNLTSKLLMNRFSTPTKLPSHRVVRPAGSRDGRRAGNRLESSNLKIHDKASEITCNYLPSVVKCARRCPQGMKGDVH